jgi:hypothetical protein
MDNFNGSSYYVKSIRDYRKWCARLYVELWVGNEYYTTVYYNLRSKYEWGYGKDVDKNNVVDFKEVEQEVREIIIDYLKRGEYMCYIDYSDDKFHEGKELHEFADICINYKRK